MESENLLNQVRHAARFGRVVPVRHARERMAERRASAADVAKAIRTARAALMQPGVDTIVLRGGVDTDGERLEVVVAFDPRGLRIITVLG